MGCRCSKASNNDNLSVMNLQKYNTSSDSQSLTGTNPKFRLKACPWRKERWICLEATLSAVSKSVLSEDNGAWRGNLKPTGEGTGVAEYFAVPVTLFELHRRLATPAPGLGEPFKAFCVCWAADADETPFAIDIKHFFDEFSVSRVGVGLFHARRSMHKT